MIQILQSSSPFFFQAEDGIRDLYVTGVQTCALRSRPVRCTRAPRWPRSPRWRRPPRSRPPAASARSAPPPDGPRSVHALPSDRPAGRLLGGPVGRGAGRGRGGGWVVGGAGRDTIGG